MSGTGLTQPSNRTGHGEMLPFGFFLLFCGCGYVFFWGGFLETFVEVVEMDCFPTCHFAWQLQLWSRAPADVAVRLRQQTAGP